MSDKFVEKASFVAAASSLGADLQRQVVSLTQFGNTYLIDVEAYRRVDAAEFHCQWQTHVAQADYREADVGEIALEHIQIVHRLSCVLSE